MGPKKVPEFIAPEQIMGGDPSPATDQYQAGALAYRLLTGWPAFGGEDPMQVIMNTMAKLPNSLREKRSEIPEGLERAVHRMLAKQPEERFPDVSAAAAELRKFLE